MLDKTKGDDECAVEETSTSANIGEECFSLIPSSISLSIKSVTIVNDVEVCIV